MPSIYNPEPLTTRTGIGTSTHSDPTLFDRSETLNEQIKLLQRAEQEAADQLRFDMAVARRAERDAAADAAQEPDFDAAAMVAEMRRVGQWRPSAGDGYARGFSGGPRA